MNSNDPMTLVLHKLAGVSERLAQEALVELLRHVHTQDDAIDCVNSLIARLLDPPILSQRVQANRFRRVLALVVKKGFDVTPLVASRLMAPHFRMTLGEFLDPADRASLYAFYKGTGVSQNDDNRTVEGDNNRHESTPPSPSIAAPLEETDKAFGTVLVLSEPDNQVGNLSLLKSEGFEPLLVQNMQHFAEVLLSASDICGCVIDGSFARTLDASKQRLLFKGLADYSTFLHIRVEDALAITHHEVRAIIREGWCLASNVAHESLYFAESSKIRHAELEEFRQTRGRLISHASTQFVLADLSPSQVQLLVAAVNGRIAAEQPGPSAECRIIEVQFLTGGLSGAKLLTVRAGDWRSFVAKITTKAAALNEVQRFRSFVQKWDSELQPQAYFHFDDAVILFGLVTDEEPERAAQPLASRLEELWNLQWMGGESVEQLSDRANSLGRSLTRAGRQLLRLNERTPTNNNFVSFVNPPIDYFNRLDDQGFEWGLSDNAIVARKRAAEIYIRLESAAVVHGDVHMRNVLVRNDSETHFIDYAGTGPGHPALDLVRFELNLYLEFVRQFTDRAQYVRFQEDFSIHRASREFLIHNYRVFEQCYVNQACLDGMLTARDAVMQVLAKHNGDAEDYLAAKYLVAWQNLGMIGRHTDLARGVIEALIPSLARSGPS